MFVLSRETGQAIVIEDVLITVRHITADNVDVTLQKITGGESIRVALPLNKHVDACYNTQLIFVTVTGLKARISIQAHRDIKISRYEFWDD